MGTAVVGDNGLAMVLPCDFCALCLFLGKVGKVCAAPQPWPMGNWEESLGANSREEDQQSHWCISALSGLC